MEQEKRVVLVVEGKNDYAKVKSVFPDVDVITTNGSEISKETLCEIEKLSQDRRVILLLDPDGPGERIRKTIINSAPSVEHVFVERALAISSNKKKVGIEHMAKEDLLESLRHIKKPTNRKTVTRLDLFRLSLIGCSDSKFLRKEVCNELGIGFANGKTLLNKINMFGYSYSELKKAVLKVKI
ncbi:ribonuclease M5 [Mycoplasmatota bacterium zrk1]